MLKNDGGFSLAGVIIAMLAVSIMAAAALPSLKGMMFERNAGRVSLLANTIINAENSYAENNRLFGTISSLQSSGYLAHGLGVNFAGGNPSSGCVYGSIASSDDTEICLNVNEEAGNGAPVETGYTLTVLASVMPHPSNYYDFYREIRHNIPGSAMVNGNEIIYIGPIAGGGGGNGSYSGYVGKSFYITGAICYITETAYINSGRGFTYTRTFISGYPPLYFIVEAVTGNNAVLSYTDDPYSYCEYSSSSTNNAGDTYSYSSWVGGAFQNSYLPEVWGNVSYSYRTTGMYYVPVETPGYEIEIPAPDLPQLIDLNQANNLN